MLHGIRIFRHSCGDPAAILRRLPLFLLHAVLALTAGPIVAAEETTIVFLQPASTLRESMAVCLRQFSTELTLLRPERVTILTEDPGRQLG